MRAHGPSMRPLTSNTVKRSLADSRSASGTRQTADGARALGRDDVGRVAPGARPGLIAIDGDPGDDACAFVLRNVRAPRRWLARREGA